MGERARKFLMHYASQYYDPEKARAYYLRTRELKGKQGQGLSAESRQKQREATSYASNEISTKRKADLDANAKVRKDLTDTARSQSEAHVARMAKIQADAKATQEKIVSTLRARLAKDSAELKIPTNASPKLRALLEKQHASRKEDARNAAKAEVKKLRDDLKATITKARDEYRASRLANTAARRTNADQRRNIVDTARKDLETEKKNIADQVR